MATPVLNNGIFLRDTSYQATSHVDSYHITNMLRGAKPDDLGPVDLWALKQKVEMPLYQFANFSGKNVVMVKHHKGEFTYQIPVTMDLPYIVRDIDEANTTKGIDGTNFKILLSRREFGHTDIITYDKMNGLELYVTEDDILPMGDGYVYTVRLVNGGSNIYLDNKFLAPGTYFFRKGSARGEYGEKYSDITTRTGVREFYNYVGGAKANVHYSVSSKADLMLKNGMLADGSIPVTEIWRNFTNVNDPSITSITDLKEKMGSQWFSKMMKEGLLQRTFLTQLEGAHLTKIGYDIESYLMWGHGGRIKTDGREDLRLTVGLWKQLDNSWKRVYNKSDFSLNLFQAELFNFYNGKVEFKGPDPKRQLIIQTGMGGMKLINEAILRQAITSGLIINASEIGAISNKGMDLDFGFAFTSFTIPFLANVKFVLNPAFDNQYSNPIENPIIDGYRLSSYSFVVFDITDNTNDNIFLLKLEWDNQLRWWYENGTMDYMGRTTGFQSSGKFSGYRVYMEQTYPAIWVKDPTRVLKLTMKNPITGGSF